MSAVLRQLAEHMQIDPPHRQRSAAVSVNDVVRPQVRGRGA